MESVDVTAMSGLVLKVLQIFLAFGQLGPAGWIASGVLALVVVGGACFLGYRIQQKKNEAANQATEQEENEAISQIENQNSTLNNDSQKTEAEIDQLFKQK